MQVNFYIEKDYEQAWSRFKARVTPRCIGQSIFFMCTDPGCMERVSWSVFINNGPHMLTGRDARIYSCMEALVTEFVQMHRTVLSILAPKVTPGDSEPDLVAKLGMQDALFMTKARRLWDPNY